MYVNELTILATSGFVAVVCVSSVKDMGIRQWRLFSFYCHIMTIAWSHPAIPVHSVRCFFLVFKNIM